ncbi:aminotransferase class V-fold PLP-dependent enzyme [Gluconacetobacter entanii]|uniref:cysteine desulfurase family protein n=1 Tax=Gluconacetobacter entanii TaxID=108528 RepID=UPI001C933648|nr:aminotransferase class V-fold PLP-dependent enzyme [Gluconacetobacter entanii]MBY4640858.1 aminotransferase class V-fold PLP-dependent enzyme [Gluconacetobacter entanii]MCW4579720.1 aminotransferase class V-fold PLP-dependent enzyme [Gluconacetobacter entanii]MCW4583126.1 aminotransferase class V-fold PLP-dependent enzyme [Gluconacetobacter entanii]MCW4586497.1 aminotransferase class V-fold PLP-dependent enzyme [Gluconacetobacter entanii]
MLETARPGDDVPDGQIYLDYQATTPCDPRVVEEMLPWFTTHFANPHSADHVAGRYVHDAVDIARARVAALIGAEAREVVFTSGATEANNLAIKGAVRHLLSTGTARRRVITVATEHKCVLESVRDLAAEGCEPVILPVGADGLLDPDVLRRALEVPTLLVSIMMANNETGVMHDMAALAPLVRGAGALLHSDLAQAAGKVAVDVRALDLASVSAHKMYGPKGVGALFVRRRPRVRLAPLFSGGGQERGLRSGTLPAPLLVGFGAACDIVMREMAADAARGRMLRDHMLHLLRAGCPGIEVNGSMEHRLPTNLNLRFPNATALDIMARAPELCVSTGSACSSAEVVASYVLTAMGLDAAQAARSLRLAVGRYTSRADVDRAAAILCRAAAGSA